MTAPKSREGQPNPDAGIVEAALERAQLFTIAQEEIWHLVNREGVSAAQLVRLTKEPYPAFAQALREGIAARRGQRFGKHGGKG